MALTPADFAAYSRATGIPYPEDPQERAALAPEVIQFRQNQLRAPQQESNPLAAFGAAALGVGALVGGIAAAKGLRRADQAFTLPRPVTKSAGTQQDVRNLDAIVKQRAAERLEQEARQQRPQGLVLTSLPQAEELASVFGDLPQPTQQELNRALNAPAQKVYRPKGGLEDIVSSAEEAEVLLTDPQTGEIFRRGRSPQGFAERYISLRPALTGQRTDLPTGRTPSNFRDFSRDVSGEAQIDALLNDPELKTLIAQQKRAEGAELGREAQRQMRVASAIEAEADQYLTQLRQQTLSAVESGEDQMTGRTMRGVQRNEDLDASQVNQVARQTGNADVAASMTPDGVPLDQTEGIDLSTGKRFLINPPRPSRTGLGPGQSIELEQVRPSVAGSSATRFLDAERQEIASQLAEQGLPISPSRIEAELSNRLSGAQAWTYGPKYTQRKQALQLGATYDPRFFENLKTPSVVIAGETIPTSALKEPVVMDETAARLQEKVNEKKDWLGNIRLKEQLNQNRIYNQLDQLSERDQRITDYLNYVDTDFPRKSSYSSPYERDITLKKRYEAEGARIEQEQINEKMGDLLRQASTSQRRVAGAQRSTQEQIGNLALPQKLKAGVEEGQRLFFQQDPETGEPIPATVELRSERRMIDTEEKGGGGRKVAEYVGGGGREEGIDLDVQNILEAAQTSQSPRYYEADQFGYTPDLEEGSFTSDRTQVGRVIDTEGVRLTNPPGRNPFEDLDTETLQQISLMGSKADSYNATKVLQRRSTPEGALRGLDVSRDIMRIKQSAPPERAQSLINQYIKNLQKF